MRVNEVSDLSKIVLRKPDDSSVFGQTILLAARARNRVIGNGGKLPWKNGIDMRWFKMLTTGTDVLVGRTTAQGMVGGLPNRKCWMLSTNPETKVEGFTTISPTLLDDLQQQSKTLFVAGGAGLYSTLAHRCDAALITEFDFSVDGDVRMPRIEEHFKHNQVIFEFPEGCVRHYSVDSASLFA